MRSSNGPWLPSQAASTAHQASRASGSRPGRRWVRGELPAVPAEDGGMRGGSGAPVDFGGLSLEEIDALLDRLEPEEREISIKRRRSHERIDLMRAEVTAGISGPSALAQLETWERRMSAERRALHESIDALYEERGRREAPPRRRLSGKGVRDTGTSLVGQSSGLGLSAVARPATDGARTVERTLSGDLRRLDSAVTLERPPALDRALTLERSLSGEARGLDRAPTPERPATLERLVRCEQRGVEPLPHLEPRPAAEPRPLLDRPREPGGA
jgi:DNA-binding transcriptional MerR regulator